MENSKDITKRGLVYDELTPATWKSIKQNADLIYATPCGWGPWVSISTGEVYHGNGGSERSQLHLYKVGPWVRIQKDTESERVREDRARMYREHEDLKDKIAELIEAER